MPRITVRRVFKSCGETRTVGRDDPDLCVQVGHALSSKCRCGRPTARAGHFRVARRLTGGSGARGESRNGRRCKGTA